MCRSTHWGLERKEKEEWIMRRRRRRRRVGLRRRSGIVRLEARDEGGVTLGYLVTGCDWTEQSTYW